MAGARETAYDLTRRVNDAGGYLNLLLRYDVGASGLDARERALATELAYGVQRHRNRLDFIIAAFSRRPPAQLDPALLDLLRLGVYQLAHLRVPAHAAVNETVELAKKVAGRGAAAYANALMRAASEGLQGLAWPGRDDLPRFLEVCRSHPLWLVQYLLRELGPREAEMLCAANNEVPSLTLRVNGTRAGADTLLREIEESGGGGARSPLLPEALREVNLSHEVLLPLLERGACMVQDESSMLVSHALHPAPGDLVVDACAAPGGKATHLASMCGGACRVIAVDVNARRLAALDASLTRMGLDNVEVRRGDAKRLGEVVREEADAVLVDAPCSGLGTLRRKPELKWRRQPGDAAVLAALQLDLLLGCADRVRAGGVMVYSVCTFTAEETTAVAERFLSRRGDFRADGHLQIWPHIHALEGMFMARFLRA